MKVLKIVSLETDIVAFADDEFFLVKRDLHTMKAIERFFLYVKCPFVISRLVKKYNISHSIAFGDMANLFSSISFSKEYKIASIHSLKSVELSRRTNLNKLFEFSYKSTYYFIDKVVCISDAIRLDLTQNCSFKFTEKLVVIYNPHPLDTIRDEAKEAILDKNETTIFNREVVLFLGRISLPKAPWHLVIAFKGLLENYPNARLVFIGDAEQNILKFLKTLILQNDLSESIFFLGRKSNPYKYLKRAKVLALSSYFEGTPNVIVEAIALNTPIVTTNCTDGIGEVVGLVPMKMSKSVNIVTNVGIISPTLYRGELKIPTVGESLGDVSLFTEALIEAFSSSEFHQDISYVESLLSKFDINTVGIDYLDEI